MSKFLPFGKQIIPTEEQVIKQKSIFSKYEYYGIPYGNFDTSEAGEGFKSQKEVDREKARLLIMQGKSIPQELEDKLLKYKQQEVLNNN